MKKETTNNTEDIKPDLKHDTMEYAASTDGDDILDMDNENMDEIEEADITADELEILEADGSDEQANALNIAEMDRTADNDIIFSEDDLEDEEAGS